MIHPVYAYAKGRGVHRRVGLFYSCTLLLLSTSLAGAQSVQSTTGTVARYGVPTGWQHQYDQVADTIVLLEPGYRQILAFVWAPGNTDQAVASLLYELGGAAYVQSIRPVRVGGYSGSEVQIDAGGGSKDWIVALPVDGMLVGIWAKIAGEIADLRGPLETFLQSYALAPPSNPAMVAGTYQTSSMSSTDWDGGGIFSEEYVTLAPNGAAARRSNIGGQVGDVSLSGDSETGGVRWEVRGNRLLFYGSDEFLNFGVQVFGNGLELFDQEGYRYNWVRQ